MSYRPNAALILLNDHEEILVGERRDVPGCWQFPQGGAKPGETLHAALLREAYEEVGLRAEDFDILQSYGPYRYQYPPGLKKRSYLGQEQTYFLGRLRPGCCVAEGEVQSPEFRCLRWIRPTAFRLEWVADFKRDVYRRVFAEILGVQLAEFEGAAGPGGEV